MIRIGKGDYLLPSNDLRTMWRLTSYEEDGSAEYSPDGKTWHTIKGTFWNLWRWDGNPEVWDVIADSIELEDWTRWEYWSGTHPTRKDAIGEAMRSKA